MFRDKSNQDKILSNYNKNSEIYHPKTINLSNQSMYIPDKDNIIKLGTKRAYDKRGPCLPE